MTRLRCGKLPPNKTLALAQTVHGQSAVTNAEPRILGLQAAVSYIRAAMRRYLALPRQGAR
jgi:hypothetical protein